MSSRPKLLPLLPQSTMPTRPLPSTPCQPSPFNKLPTELKITILTWLLVHDLPQLGRTTPEFNHICNTPQVWKHLLKRDYNVSVVPLQLEKETFHKYFDIICVFGNQYPVITDLGLELMNKFVPRIWWKQIKTIYDRDARSYDEKYPDILDWGTVKNMVIWYLQSVDPERIDPERNSGNLKYITLANEIEMYVANHFKLQIEQAKVFVESPTVTDLEIDSLINSLIKTPQIVFLRGKMIIFEFNYDLMLALEDIVFRGSHPYYIDEDFYESVGTKLLDLFE